MAIEDSTLEVNYSHTTDTVIAFNTYDSWGGDAATSMLSLIVSNDEVSKVWQEATTNIY